MGSRGGAGNILAREQEKARFSADLEANQQVAESTSSDRTSASREQQRFAHSGRGGAGNWYSPQELSQTGRFSDAQRSHVLGDGTPLPTDGSGGHGRGGAGNYTFGVSESEQRAAMKRMDEEKRKQQVQADVEKGVKAALAEPPKAKLTGAQPF